MGTSVLVSIKKGKNKMNSCLTKYDTISVKYTLKYFCNFALEIFGYHYHLILDWLLETRERERDRRSIDPCRQNFHSFMKEPY